MNEEEKRTDRQYKKIGEKIIDELCGRSGFDAAFDVDEDILEEIKLEMGQIAYKESLKCLHVDNY